MIVVSSWESEPTSSLGARHAATTALLVAHEGRRRRCRSGSAFGGEQVLEPDREATNAHAGGMPNRVGDGAGGAGDGDLTDALDAERIDVAVVLMDEQR